MLSEELFVELIQNINNAFLHTNFQLNPASQFYKNPKQLVANS